MELLQQYGEFTYLISVVIATFVVLKWFFEKTTSKQRNLITACVGFVLGIVWLEFIQCSLGGLILAYFAAIGFYEKIIKWIMNKLNIQYDDKVD